MQTSPASVKEPLEDQNILQRKGILLSMQSCMMQARMLLDDIKNLPDKVYTSASDVNNQLENK